MDNVRTMDVKATSQKLVHEILTMIISKVLTRVNNSMHISFHEIRNNVDIFKTRLSRRLCYINESDNVFVIEEFYFAATKITFKYPE